ncbi:MAG: class I SAM-dependent methyltransferase [Elusimicrobia bacterium]|nr:class I SAM-dependent methyltransferase [Elusimicrobiota bacterium]
MRVDGFPAWATDLTKRDEGFSAQNFERLAQVEADSFWFRSRNALILWVIHKDVHRIGSLLEVGCGTGFVLAAIAKKFPGVRIVGADTHTAGLSFAAHRVPTAELLQMDARQQIFVDEFDVIAAFDVIEHIQEDETVLRNFHRAIKPGGTCLITVPQHPRLWSSIDEESCHKRRYRSKELHEKLESAGFRIVRSTSFVTFLLPFLFLSRMTTGVIGKKVNDRALHLNPLLDIVLEAVMFLERQLIKLGFSLPLGGSRLVVAVRKDD